MATEDTPLRKFQVRHLSKAIRSYTRRYRIHILSALFVFFLFSFFSLRSNTANSISDTIRNNPTIASLAKKSNGVFHPLVHTGPQHQAPIHHDSHIASSDDNPQTGLGSAPHSDASAPLSDPVREDYRHKKLSVVVLFHNEYDSLRTALSSWISNGLIAEIDELLIFMNGGTSESDFTQHLPEISQVPESKRKIVVSRENLKLGLAITRMVELAEHEFVMLLEKDWALIEDSKTTASRLLDSKVIIGTGVAQLIRHRHRHNPGVPLHALIMHQGREDSIMRGQKNLMCFVHHWQKDPTLVYPGKGLMWRCGGKEHHLEEDDVFCSKGEYCQWNNNPCVFKKDWFMSEIGERYRIEYKKEHDKYGDSSPFLDFEYYTNWRSYAWTDKNYTVAVGEGLFSHAESEHKHFNTFWYAHYRLETDYEELRNQYLKNETMLKRKGAHYDTDGPPPAPMLDRYPTEFARKFHWDKIFQGSLQTQREEIGAIYNDFVSKYKVPEEEFERSGKNSANYDKAVGWRDYVTRMHFCVEKGELMVPPLQPYEMNFTLVTTLMDIGRSNLDADDGGYRFRREFKMYLDKMQDWLAHEYPKIVYTTQDIADELMKSASEHAKLTTKFVITSRKELATKWIGSDNYQRVQDIRQSKEWLERASWLQNSPQAKLADYNPLVMAKMFMMRDAARNNPWQTTHFLFLDAKHNCMDPNYMNPKHDHILRAHMFGKFLLTYFDYKPADEIHGFAYEPFNDFLNIRDRSQRQTLKIGRGGIFGGSAYSIEYITAMYDVVLTATLRQNLMGTEENIFSILAAQVPQYFDLFSNNWACFRTVEKDHKCPDRKDQGYNCEIFSWMKNNV